MMMLMMSMLMKIKIGNRTKMISEHRKNRYSNCYIIDRPMTSQHVESKDRNNNTSSSRTASRRTDWVEIITKERRTVWRMASVYYHVASRYQNVIHVLEKKVDILV